MAKNIRKLKSETRHITQEEFGKARLILEYAHESAHALLKAFDDIRKNRGATRGTSTDEEQDLLRAMLVLAAAGLDSMIKQLIRGTLPALVELDEKVQQGLQTFVARQLRSETGESGGAISRFLARLLVAESHQKEVIREYIGNLTGGSLQSPEEVMKAAFALGLDPAAYGIDTGKLAPIFSIRNKIIHELDINFDAPRRNRQSRSRNKMIEHTNVLLETGENMLVAVFAKVQGVTKTS